MDCEMLDGEDWCLFHQMAVDEHDEACNDFELKMPDKEEFLIRLNRAHMELSEIKTSNYESDSCSFLINQNR